MKSNTTPAFTLIALHRRDGNRLWLDALRHWFSGVRSHLVTEAGVLPYWKPHRPAPTPTLVAGFIVIDVIAEASADIPTFRTELGLAEKLADTMLGWRWPDLGLVPMAPGGDIDHLDGQVDFAIALARLMQLCDRSDLGDAGRALLTQAVKHHYCPPGWATHVRMDGTIPQRAVNQVDPKYNGLLLKGLIALETWGQPIYPSAPLRDLFKDR